MLIFSFSHLVNSSIQNTNYKFSFINLFYKIFTIILFMYKTFQHNSPCLFLYTFRCSRLCYQFSLNCIYISFRSVDLATLGK